MILLECPICAMELRVNKMTAEPDWVYRLPTGNEWEHACRGGPLSNLEDYGFDYYAGSPSNTLPADKANSRLAGLERTCKVGSFPPNQLGLFDMHGNVAEWVDDTLAGNTRRVRGGSWVNNVPLCCTTIIYSCPATTQSDSIGFRLAHIPR